MISIREFDEAADLKAVEDMERSCDVGPSTSGNTSNNKKKNSGVSLYVDQLGDPLCRVRHSPEHIMLVAECQGSREIVGTVRACVKIVTRGVAPSSQLPSYVKLAYILGLRVSPAHRRLGIGAKLVETIESWCIDKGAEYAYIATDRTNSPSLNLFTHRLSYKPFRSLTILTQPVHSHPLPLPHPSKSNLTILQLPPSLSTPLYLTLFANSEFLPLDLHSLFAHPLTLGTFLAIPSGVHWDPIHIPSSFAIMSLWNSKEIFHLRVSGASKLTRAAIKVTRAIDKMLPCLNIPSLRDVFRPFGVYLMYGMRMEGDRGEELMQCLCRFAHNLAMQDGDVAAVVCEVGGDDGVREAVPHWKRLSCEEDVWCMKRLAAGHGDGHGGDDDWSKSLPGTDVIFVDPREF